MARYTGNSIKTTVSPLRYLPGQRPSLEISVRKLIRFPGPRCLLARLTVYEWYLQEKEIRVGATPSLGINPAADRRPVKEQPVVASRVRPREKTRVRGETGRPLVVRGRRTCRVGQSTAPLRAVGHHSASHIWVVCVFFIMNTHWSYPWLRVWQRGCLITCILKNCQQL